MTTLPTFGKPSNEWGRSGGASQSAEHEIFLKNFRDDVTRPVQILDDDPESWVKYAMHFDKANRMSYPCAKAAGAEECFGCSYPSSDPDNENDPGARVRKLQWQWVFPALDPKGYVSLYQIGVNFWTELKTTKATYGTLLGHQWAVVRTKPDDGSFRMNYSAKILPGEQPREVKFDVPTKAYISGILTKKYMRAAETYGYAVGGGVDEAQGYNPPAVTQVDPANLPPETVAALQAKSVEEEFPGLAAAEASATKPDLVAGTLAAHAEVAAQKAEGLEQGVAGETAPSPVQDWNSASTPDVKAFLDSHDVEYSSKAPRSVLVGLANKTAKAQA